MIRKYEKDVRKAAAIIAYEVIMTGESSGWVSSDFDFFKKLKEILSEFNIDYVDDLNGTWAVL